MTRYLRDPARIYAESLRILREEAQLERFPPDVAELAARVVHACGMVDAADSLAYSPDCVAAGRAALARGAPIFCDCAMTASGVIRRALPTGVEVVATIADPSVRRLAEQMGTTRSAAAVTLWRDRLEGAVVAIGNAPTALFHLLELIEAGAPKPAVILGFRSVLSARPKAKTALAEGDHGVPFAALMGRRGGSAMAAAAVNALTLGPGGDGVSASPS